MTTSSKAFEHAIAKMNERHPFDDGVVEYDYDHDGWCGCNDDYCHHHKINNAEVKEVNVDYIVKELVGDCNDVIAVYCIDRVVRNSNLPDIDSWEVDIGEGYYGEQVDGVLLEEGVKKQIVKQLTELNSLTTDIDRIKKVLEYEYGYILPKIKDLTTAKVVSVNLYDVKLLNDEYLRKVSKETVDYYQSYELPRGVCMKESDKYSLIDGYHRMFSALKYKVARVVIIELS
jgi:hypothetical protein